MTGGCHRTIIARLEWIAANTFYEHVEKCGRAVDCRCVCYEHVEKCGRAEKRGRREKHCQGRRECARHKCGMTVRRGLLRLGGRASRRRLVAMSLVRQAVLGIDRHRRRRERERQA